MSNKKEVSENEIPEEHLKISVWTKPEGGEIKLNNFPATIAEAKELGFKKKK